MNHTGQVPPSTTLSNSRAVGIPEIPQLPLVGDSEMDSPSHLSEPLVLLTKAGRRYFRMLYTIVNDGMGGGICFLPEFRDFSCEVCI